MDFKILSADSSNLELYFTPKNEIQLRIISDHITCKDLYYLIWRLEDGEVVWYLMTLQKKVFRVFDNINKCNESKWILKGNSLNCLYYLVLKLHNEIIYALYKELNDEKEEIVIKTLHICPRSHVFASLLNMFVNISHIEFPYDEMDFVDKSSFLIDTSYTIVHNANPKYNTHKRLEHQD